MKLLSYQSNQGPRVAALRLDGYVDLNRADSSLPATLRELLVAGKPALDRAAVVAASGQSFDPADTVLLPPVTDPQKIICVGLNYADHARESGAQPPPEPVLFNKFPTALSAADKPIVLPAVSQEVDYEAELVVVIGRGGRHIPRGDALAHVAGYMCGNDVSARDWQLRKPGHQWLLGKSFDTFAPTGPALVTPDEVGDPGQLGIRLRLNGQTMQDSNTRQFLFPVDELIAYVSQVATLHPGDLIFTGTPPGVGFARKPPVFLQPGDVVEVEIDKLGTLRNTVIAEQGR